LLSIRDRVAGVADDHNLSRLGPLSSTSGKTMQSSWEPASVLGR
jgi:hypothetical protein